MFMSCALAFTLTFTVAADSTAQTPEKQLAFDIRRYVCNADTPDAQIQTNFRRINLSVHLLHGINYATLYDTKIYDLFFGTLPGTNGDTMAARLQKAHENGLLLKDEYFEIVKQMGELKAKLEGTYTGLPPQFANKHPWRSQRMRELVVDDKSNSAYSLVRTCIPILRKIHNQGIELPFIGNVRREAGKNFAEVLDSLKKTDSNSLGSLTEETFYTTPRTSENAELARLVDMAKELGVLKYQLQTAVSGGPVITSDNGSNKANGCCCCTTAPLCRYIGASSNTFCSIVNDQCSLASDPCGSSCPTLTCGS